MLEQDVLQTGCCYCYPMSGVKLLMGQLWEGTSTVIVCMYLLVLPSSAQLPHSCNCLCMFFVKLASEVMF